MIGELITVNCDDCGAFLNVDSDCVGFVSRSGRFGDVAKGESDLESATLFENHVQVLRTCKAKGWYLDARSCLCGECRP